MLFYIFNFAQKPSHFSGNVVSTLNGIRPVILMSHWTFGFHTCDNNSGQSGPRMWRQHRLENKPEVDFDVVVGCEALDSKIPAVSAVKNWYPGNKKK